MAGRQDIRRGQRVRDLEGRDLGRVARIYESGFLVGKGFPVLFRQEVVLRWEELRGERDGELVVARSDRALFELAAGGVPESWRIPAPPEFPTAATPGEAQGVRESLAAQRAQGSAGVEGGEGEAEAASTAGEPEAARREERAARESAAHAP